MLGTGASFWADITLLAYILLILPLMILGYYFARRKLFDPQHKIVMTLVLMLNYLLIAAVMLRSFGGVSSRIPENLGDLDILLPTIHMIIGGIAQLSATYLILLMWTENTRFENIVIYRVKRFKNMMRVTLVLWITTIVMGFGIYAVWYTPNSNAAGDVVPVSTEEVTTTEEATPELAVTEEITPDVSTTEALTPAVDTTEEFSVDTTEEASVQVTEQVQPPVVTEEPEPCFASTEEAIIAITEEADIEDDDCEDFLDDLEDRLEDEARAREEAEEERREAEEDRRDDD